MESSSSSQHDPPAAMGGAAAAVRGTSHSDETANDDFDYPQDPALLSDEHSKMILRALILSNEVGGLIGKGGSTIRSMREETGCKIMISDAIPQVHERILTAIGPADMVAKAYCLIAGQLEKEAGAEAAVIPDGHRSVSVNLLVPSQQTGAIIGKGGSRIKELREESAAHITVAAEPLPQSNERLVTVTGAAESIGKAITAIVGILHKNRVRGTVIPFHPQVRLQQFQYNAWTAPAAYAYNAAQAPMSAGAFFPAAPAVIHPVPTVNMHPAPLANAGVSHTEPSHVWQVVPINAEFAGAVIGKSGARINEIRQMSGTHIKIENAAPGAAERQIIILGTPHACHAAVAMIRQRIDEELQRRQSFPQ